MEVLSSRTLLRPSDFQAAVQWYRDALGLSIYREYGIGGQPTGVVFFLGGGFLELVSGGSPVPQAPIALWLQVPDVDAEHERMRERDVAVIREPATEPWGLRECWIAGPDDTKIVLVEVLPDHPLRRRLD